MTDRENKPRLWKRLDLDWVDIAGLLGLVAVFSGVWLMFTLGLALLVLGGLLVGFVLLVYVRTPRARSDGRL